MSRTRVPAELRRLVGVRAEGLCEYCRIHEDDTFYGCEVDHIVSEKHGGLTVAENLAYSCLYCNRFKGSDLGSLTAATGLLIRFFNPRADAWSDHFALDGVIIRPTTAIGEVTKLVFKFNEIERLMERAELEAVGRYPFKSADEQS
jgi:HNH endonuclease